MVTGTAEESSFDERAALLSENDHQRPSVHQDGGIPRRVPPQIARKLYISHILSTWNSNVFQFGTVLYLATIYPGTLLPMSIYASGRGLSAMLFAPTVGRFIDTRDRLYVVRLSIVVQRIAVAGSCVIFYFLVLVSTSTHGGLLALLAILACFEKLASIMNLVSIEKDWVVIVSKGDPEALRIMNAQMRRIDLLCQLLGPLFIAFNDGVSTEAAIVVTFAMNVASVVVEYFAIARVYIEVPELQESKQRSALAEAQERTHQTQSGESRIKHNFHHLREIARKSVVDFEFYFQHRAFIPSIARALLFLTVLSFGGQMVTYLLSAGYSSTEIGIARTFSVAFEVMATWVAPWIMGKIGPVRAGLWLSNWQVLTLITGLLVFWIGSRSPVISASGLILGTILSRVGLRGFDLCAQVIVQEEVEAESRGLFSSVEAAFQSAFGLLSFASTMVFSRPDQFKWPALISTIAITLACASYAAFVRLRRHHLVHWEYLGQMCGSEKEDDAREHLSGREI